jgi:DNA-binding transcriptional regulator YdaS (Cro superfamily)
MRLRLAGLLGVLVFCSMQPALSQEMKLPKAVAAGQAFSIESTGSGKAVLYVVGLGQVIRRDVQLGQTESFPAGNLYNAGHYLAFLVGASSKQSGSFDVVPADKAAALSFLAKPSRLPVGQRKGISGAVFVFDAYQNLVTAPLPVSFELSNQLGATQARTVVSRDGSAWTEMDSSTKEGAAKFVARVGGVSSTRVIQQVPGEPCGLTMSAQPSGQRIELETALVHDCSGNEVPDGTIVTFTETYHGSQSTVDVPLKHGVARVEMPAYNGAKISVASGVVMGNEIRWPK